MRSRTPDRLCAEAVDVALAVTLEAAGPDSVGEHLGVVAEGDRVVTHLFACKEPAYRGWQWATTLTRAARAKNITIDETVLLPGADAVLAPEWVPWSDRLRPGDLGPGDLLPTEADDLRLEPGWTGEGAQQPAPWQTPLVPQGPAGEAVSMAPGEPAAQVPAEPVPAPLAGPLDEPLAESLTEADIEVVDTKAAGGAGTEGAGDDVVETPSIAEISSVAAQLGLGRARVLSRYGLHTAADRWEEQFGPKTPMAQGAPAPCASCGFLVPVGGSLSQAFGVCANEFSPADGRMVSLAYGCGAHSEAAVMPAPPHPVPMVLDEFRDTEPMPLHPDRTSSVDEGEAGAPAEDDLGHS